MCPSVCHAQATEGYSGEDNPNRWVYIKVKRRKSTFFLHIDLSETISEVKAKLQELVEKVRSCLCKHSQVVASA